MGVQATDTHFRRSAIALLLLASLVLVSVPLAPYAHAQTVVKPPDAADGTLVLPKVYASLYQTSKAPYGASDSAYLKDVQNPTGPLFYTNGKPILVYVGAEYCMYCAAQRWALIMALMRFGNFTNLEYMHSSVSDGDYATFTFVNSTYHSNYVVFQPYEVYDRAGNALETLPASYASSFQQYGRSAFPFLNFANEYYISGSLLDPSIFGTQNQTQIISAVQARDPSVSQIKQAANLMTAVICKTTGYKPASVCGQDSIVALTDLLVSYTPTTTSKSIISPTTTMSPFTSFAGPTSASTSSSGIPEFPVQLGFVLLVTAVILASYVVARRTRPPRTGPKSGASGSCA